jgi:hypothetical protein
MRMGTVAQIILVIIVPLLVAVLDLYFTNMLPLPH